MNLFLSGTVPCNTTDLPVLIEQRHIHAAYDANCAEILLSLPGTLNFKLSPRSPPTCSSERTKWVYSFDKPASLACLRSREDSEEFTQKMRKLRCALGPDRSTTNFPVKSSDTSKAPTQRGQIRHLMLVHRKNGRHNRAFLATVSDTIQPRLTHNRGTRSCSGDERTTLRYLRAGAIGKPTMFKYADVAAIARTVLCRWPFLLSFGPRQFFSTSDPVLTMILYEQDQDYLEWALNINFDNPGAANHGFVIELLPQNPKRADHLVAVAYRPRSV
ncbi:hypothetical protein C8R45DRAFT_929720 [Mycena sanguinolenta]|nr:hypothetical protein C8R45DRAFT_929720 [Mycena sanguinolenta]